MPRSCVVGLDSIQSIPKAWLERLMARLRPQRMAEVERAMRFAFALAT